MGVFQRIPQHTLLEHQVLCANYLVTNHWNMDYCFVDTLMVIYFMTIQYSSSFQLQKS